MSDPRDFDMGRLPGIEGVLATGVPESCSMADLFPALEAPASVALDRGQTHCACPQCASCHCHDCVMQEREVKRQAVQALVDERDELREQVARWKREFRSYAVHADARCEHFGKCQCGLRELLAESLDGLKDESSDERPEGL